MKAENPVVEIRQFYFILFYFIFPKSIKLGPFFSPKNPLYVPKSYFSKSYGF
jgi:hypothetical protein